MQPLGLVCRPSALLLCVLTLLVVVSAASSADTALGRPKCLDMKEVFPKRFLFYRGQTLPVTIESSLRPAHMVLTRIFSLFLKEVLGYASVTYFDRDDRFNSTVAIEGLHNPLELEVSFPKAMINLEIPLSANHDMHIASGLPRGSIDVEDSGNLGPVGGFSWFVPSSMINRYKSLSLSQPSPDHWRVFTRPEWTSMFEQDISQFAKYTRAAASNEYFCRETYCPNGTFTPDQCKKGTKCATLLVGYANYSEFVVPQIKEMKLFVRVVWVGPYLQMLSEQWANNFNSGNGKAVVALSWHPGPLTARNPKKFTSVSFPACEPDDPMSNWPCSRLTLHRFVKSSWRVLKVQARAAFEAVNRLILTTAEYEEILNLIPVDSPVEKYESIACEWLRANGEIWFHWVPHEDNERTKIYIGGIFPMTGDVYTARGIMAAASMAVKAVNDNPNVLSDYFLQLHAFDGQCKADYVMRSFIDYIRLPSFNQLAGILGPACSDTVEPLAGVSRHYKMVIISYSAEGASFTDRTKYPFFFRTIGENKQYKYVYLELLKKIGWKRVAALTEDGQKYTEYISHMQDYMQQNGIVFVANRKFPRERGEYSMSQYLEDLKSKSARIIIADVYDDAARTVMCEAFKHKMTSKQGYIWFLPLWLQTTWYDTDLFNKMRNETVQCTTAEMMEAINGHLALTHAYYAPDTDIMQEGITIGQWKKNYKKRCDRSTLDTSNYGGYAYDGVWTYAYALEKLFKENQSYVADLHTDVAIESFVKYLSETDFNGVSGHIKFRNGPSRVSVVNVVQWLNNATYIVGSFYPNVSETKGEIIGGRLDLNVSAIRWLSEDGKMPDDGTEPPPSCFVDPIATFFNSSCETAIIIANLLGFGIVAGIVVVIFFYMKRRYERETKKYMQSIGIDLLPTSTGLDKWEVPREDVVVNRKLGEGAFGTVYGGEANFAEKGWVAVAVKTLKLGSTIDIKLDFLSEAEVMKRLDHQNIVRLLGVCTKNEPVYTIMEFMLYGDLKTFLLARRHLVMERGSGEENEEISAKKLTNMALDVARALVYLGDLKYVHRDVACRNCLVNANRIVKLGDFGMTRAMYESDYYRFNRKGMLPVRWMAPESLELGIFTAQSDIWSFGVMLYEIVTFGSFPYQGLSNGQVLEYIKAGHPITTPKGIKPNLELLMRQCWKIDRKKRISAVDVMEVLANNPRLIAPSLESPGSALPFEDTAQIEMNMPEKGRKCSVTLTKNRQRSLSGGNALPSTTPNSPTSLEPEPKLSRSATSHDVQQPNPPLRGSQSNGTCFPQTLAARFSPDTVPLLDSRAAGQSPPSSFHYPSSGSVPMLSQPPCNGEFGDYIENGGSAYMNPRRTNGGPTAVKLHFPPRKGDDPDFTSVL